ncbi:MAG: response regulator [Gammaproteobacteria bacterium]|nr:response regulator [Gammaproteobacteria bacterium]
MSGEYTVLIVDDSKTVVHALKMVLEQAGYNTLTATGGEQAIELARQQKPDVVLMDVIMPGMTGFQATRILHKDPATAHIPVVIISASEQPSEKAWCKRLGAKGFLPKPIQRGKLFPCLEDILNLDEMVQA